MSTTDDFDPRLIQYYEENVIRKVQNQVSIKKTQKIYYDWTYTDCMKRFEKSLTSVKKPNTIQDILKEAIERLESEGNSANGDQEMLTLNCLLLSGAPDIHPRNCVDKLGAR